MAVFVAGKTTCPLCSRVIQTDENVINFPPLFLNHHHAVFELTDAVVHRPCLDSRPYARLALDKFSVNGDRRVRPQVCKICGRVISWCLQYGG